MRFYESKHTTMKENISFNIEIMILMTLKL